MKKFLAMLCTIALLMTSVFAVSAENEDIKVTLNGHPITFDVPPQIISNRTMVPLRAVFEAMGAMVIWVDYYNEISIQLSGEYIWMNIGDNTMGTPKGRVQLDSPPCIIDGRTLVPVRAISESLGADVNWNEAIKTVEIAYQPIYPMPVNSQKLAALYSYWYSVADFEKETLSNKEFALNFIGMWIDYDEKDPIYIRGGQWDDDAPSDANIEWVVLGDRDKLNSEYKLLFGYDMPYLTEEDVKDSGIVLYNGQFAADTGRYDFGEPGDYVYDHAEEKPDGSYDIIFLFWTDYDDDGHYLGEYRLDDSKDVFNISLADNKNGFIINSRRTYENGVLQPLYYED